MTHLPYIVAAYALGVLIPATFAAGRVPAHAAPRSGGWPRSTRGQRGSRQR